MKLGDRKQVMIAGGIVAVALIALLFVIVKGKKSPEAAGPGMGAMRGGRGTLTSAPAAPGTPGGAEATVPTGGPGAPGVGMRGGPGGTMATTGGPGGADTGAGTETTQLAQAPMLGVVRLGTGETSVVTRPDPMLTFVPPPPPILPEQRVTLPLVQTMRGGLRFQQPGPERPGGQTVEQRRVAGIKFNGGAWAILEKGGESFVVKPGDTVEGTRVLSISRDQIMVVDSDGQRWQVPLRGAWPTAGGPTQLGGSRAGQAGRAGSRGGQMGRRGGQTAGMPTSPPGF